MTVFLTIEDVLEIHRQVIESTGGSPGVRDIGLLDSAIHRPQATFGGVLLYPDLAHQAAALLESLGRNHPFVDGNKRAAFTAMDAFLRHNGKRLTATEDEKYEFVINVVTGQLRIEEIVAWIAPHMKTA
jgi:death-on-curing protein